MQASHTGNQRRGLSMVYELFFMYWDDDPKNDDEVIVAVYSSYEKAKAGRKKFLQQPRFKGKDEFLEIYEYEMNETAWEEGFCRDTWEEVFIIKLLSGYEIEKEADYNPEIRNIKIRNQEKTKVYQGTMDYYYDHEKFLCLKNIKTGIMYCFDKEKEKMQYQTKDYDIMLKFLNQHYGIEHFGWRDIFRK